MDRLSAREFIDLADRFGVPGLLKRSILAFRDGAETLDRILGEGKYPVVLEIGTYRGVSAAYMAQHCQRVITVDLINGQLEQDGETFDRSAFWRHMGVSDSITSVTINDDRQKAGLIPHFSFDLAFIDGGLVNVADDFNLVRGCGTVLFHDYDKTRKRKIVFDFVNSLPRDEVEILGMFALWHGR